MQIGADTADLKRNVEKIDDTLGGIGKTASAVGGMLAGAFTIGAISSFVTGLVESASHIADLAAKTGVSTEAIQRWEYAVNLSGGTIDQVSKSVLFMSKTLATGGDSAVAALNKAGLSFKDIKGLAPEQAFNEIAGAIKGIKDPMEQAQVTMALFGKTGVEMLPAIRDGMKEVGDAASIMSSDTIEAFDMIGDAWTTTVQFLKVQTAEWITKPFREWKDLIAAIKQDLSGLPAIAAQIETPDLFKKPEETIGKTGKALDDMLASSQALNKETEESVRKSDAYESKIRALADTFTGKDLQGKVNDIAAAMELANKQGGIGETQFAALAKQAAELRDKGAKLTPELSEMAKGFDILQFNAHLVELNAKPIAKTIGDIGKAAIGAKPDIVAFNDKLSDLIKTAQAGGGPASLSAIENLGTKIKELPAPPIEPWDTFTSSVTSRIGNLLADLSGPGGYGEALKTFGSDFARDFVSTSLNILVPGLGTLVEAAWPLIEKGLIALWGGIKSFFGGMWNGIKSLFGGGSSGVDVVKPGESGYTPPQVQTGYEGGFDPGNPYNATSGDGGMLNMDPSGGMITPFAAGGIVTRPMVGLVGEAGPEAIIPLSSGRGLGSTVVNLNIDARGAYLDDRDGARRLAERIAPMLPGVVQRYRLA